MASSDGSRFMRSGTNFYMWGMMFLFINKEHSISYYIEHLVHECAHTTLNLINAKDELVINRPEERFSAPFRKDSRPMIGIFHAYFVLSRVCYVFNILKIKVDNSMKNEVVERFDYALNKLKETYGIIEEHAKFTKKGLDLHESIKYFWKL